MGAFLSPRLDSAGTLRAGPLRQGHWSTRGLVLCNTFAQSVPAAAYPRSLVGAMSSSAASAVMGNPLGMSFPLASYHLEHPNFADAPLTQATVLCIRKCADTTLRQGFLFGADIPSGTNRLLAHVPFSDSTVYWDFGGAGAVGGRLSVAITKTTNVEKWAFIAGPNGLAIWRDGVRLAASGTPAPTRTSEVATFAINGAIAVQDGDIQDIYFFALLDAEWTPTQIREWTDNPWLMLAAPPWPIGLPGAAVAGAPTIFYAQQRSR